MKSRVRLLGHPLHPMLIVFPLGLLGMAPIFDLIGLIRHETRWSEVAFWLIGAGIITGLLGELTAAPDPTATLRVLAAAELPRENAIYRAHLASAGSLANELRSRIGCPGTRIQNLELPFAIGIFAQERFERFLGEIKQAIGCGL